MESVEEMAESLVLERARQRDEPAFQELHRRYERKVYGRLRVRVENDMDADDLAQRTWLEVWRRMSDYDPAREFIAFVFFWAGILLKRYYTEQQSPQARILLFSQLSRTQDVEEEGEIETELARLSAKSLMDTYGALGEDVQDSESTTPPTDVYLELLRLTFNGTSPPHQLVTFGFVKLLGWKPRTVVASLSSVALHELEERLEVAYINRTQLRENVAAACFDQLRRQMQETFEEVVKEPITRKTYPHLLTCVVGTTTLQQYFTKPDEEGRADNVVKWRAAVHRRVWKEVQRLTHGPLFDWLQTIEKRW
jgi:DNA-directed RNA polymerase specialized sigma24 family protein